MSNQHDTSSFYPSGNDNSADVKSRPTPEEIFLREIHHLNDPGPFLSDEKRIALRAFAYKDVTLFGFLIEETREAFMVLLPASLSRDESGVKATQVIASPIARLMKNSVGIMSLPTPVQTLYYLSLILKQVKTCPGYFTSARILQITNLIGILKIGLGVSEPIEQKSDKVKSESLSKTDSFQVPDELIPRITH